MSHKRELEAYFGAWAWVMKERRRAYSELAAPVLMERPPGPLAERNKDIRNCFARF
jgi:hypothetical protein